MQKKDKQLEQYNEILSEHERLLLDREAVIKMLSGKEEEQSNIIKILRNNLEMRSQADGDVSIRTLFERLYFLKLLCCSWIDWLSNHLIGNRLLHTYSYYVDSITGWKHETNPISEELEKGWRHISEAVHNCIRGHFQAVELERIRYQHHWRIHKLFCRWYKS